MNVRLNKSFSWANGVIYDGKFFINQYTIELSMLTATVDHIEQNTAYDRLKVFIGEILQDSVFVSSTYPELAKWKPTGVRLIALPDDPVDQLMGIMLYIKLNAIMEQRLIITDVKLSSQLGDNMIYLHSEGDNPGPLAHDGWWNDCRPCWGMDVTKRSREKIVTMDRCLDWKHYGLEWNTDTPAHNSSMVVFADFPKNEDQ